ncbi:MAG: shikimate kinase [Cyclobacteriaceae bacterium]|nr:shikimate kinase [Cyclobacteriaceae bacterium]
MHRIYLTGLPGCGKSYLGRNLSKKLHLQFFDLDDVIVESEKISINEIFAQKGEKYFRELESRLLKELSNSHSSFIMATGGGAPCFHDNMAYMNTKGITIFLDVSPPEIVKRLSEKGLSKRPLLKDVGPENLVKELEIKLQRRLPYYSQAKIHVNKAPDYIMEHLISEIGKY